MGVKSCFGREQFSATETLKRQQLFLRNPEDEFLYASPVFGDKVFSVWFLKAVGIILESCWSLFRLCGTRNIWTLAHTCLKRLEKHCSIPCMPCWSMKVPAVRQDTLTAS